MIAISIGVEHWVDPVNHLVSSSCDHRLPMDRVLRRLLAARR